MANAAGVDPRPESPTTLICSSCRRAFPVVDGIPDMVVYDETPADFRQREMAQWDDQAAHYDEGRFRDPIYMAGVEACANALEPQEGDFVLDLARWDDHDHEDRFHDGRGGQDM